ncbi:DUF1574 domain-containing protein [Mucilaginibacter sp. BJC16-A38]|uniref:DUF1574 domain-containing protein n=1 Tax=Mucilaginibacter phenanthrenivorans TaxID=1234842 RepID=UPI0021586F1E|nr:DUF1574 domain-containing protein [Mucilaginibacter phenanthrenivorans]MCR8559509.1 DUF1574 domain-containing protein [Mucilaginibacter phenanthrenivorans]
MKNKLVVRFFVRLAGFSVILIAADRLVGFGLKKAYFNQRVGQFSQTTYAIDSTFQDVMIFGSSRAVRHYSPSIISKYTGLSCYDSGRDGLMIPYSAAMEEISLSRHIPKVIILDITPRELGIDKSKYEKLDILLPYCDEHQQFIKYIKEVSPFETYKLFSKTYPYNSSAFILAHNIFFAKSAEKDDNGYLPLTGAMTKPEMEDYSKRMNIRALRTRKKNEVADIKAINYFKRFLENAAREKITTLVIISPTILNNAFYLDNQTLERGLIEKISREYPNVIFLDYSTDPRFNYHPEKFDDVFHLNKLGSEEYSAIIGQRIKAKLNTGRQQLTNTSKGIY